jgi:hypothetical protein
MEDEKTVRIGMLMLLLAFLGIFVFAYKVEACKSKPEDCRDEFVEIPVPTVDHRGNLSRTEHRCATGATVEVVTSPPAPKPGIMCKCPSRSAK